MQKYTEEMSFLVFKFGVGGAGQVQGGSVWKKQTERKKLNIQIAPEMRKNKAMFLNFKVLLPGGVLPYCSLLNVRSILEKFPRQACDSTNNCHMLVYDAREIYLRLP